MYEQEAIELSQNQLDTVAGGGKFGRGFIGTLVGEAVWAAGKWLGEKFDEYKDKRGDTFEHWG